MSNVILKAKQITKVFTEGDRSLAVLKGLDLEVNAGEFVAIVGASGSGKSTLLHTLAGLDTPTSGEVAVLGQPLSTMTDAQRGAWRNQHMGFIYQFHHLLAEFTALENVLLPRFVLKLSAAQQQHYEQEAVALLQRVGLADRLDHFPAQLSGGERQRVAIARAVINRPKLLMADEPTGNLDQKTAQQVLSHLFELREVHQTALVMVTHDAQIAAQADRVLTMQDGLWVV